MPILSRQGQFMPALPLAARGYGNDLSRILQHRHLFDVGLEMGAYR